MAQVRTVINGQELSRFKAFNLVESIDQLSIGLTFTAIPNKDQEFIIKELDPVTIYIDDEIQMVGQIEAYDDNGTSGDRVIQFRARDILKDVIDSSLDVGLEISSPISLQALIRQVLNHMGFDKIKVLNPYNIKIDKFTKDELISPEPTEKGFSFLDRYCQQRQVFLGNDGKGNIIIQRRSGIKGSGSLISRFNETGNVLSRQIKSQSQERYATYKVITQQNPSSLISIDPSSISNQSGIAIDKEIERLAKNRKIVFRLENSGSSKDCLERAKWQSNYSRAVAKEMIFTVQGFYQENGNLWKPNILIPVIDEYSGTDTQMLVRSVRKTKTIGNGEITELSLIPPDSMIPKPTSKSKNIANKYKGGENPNLKYQEEATAILEGLKSK